MAIALGYIGVIVIWSTTPLTIKWSGESVGFLYGVSARMALALAVCLMIFALIRKTLPMNKSARQSYIAAGLPLYSAMFAVYWAAQYIPSGMISVLFGLTPLFTGVFSVYILKHNVFNRYSVLGMALGLGGLCVIFSRSLDIGENAVLGITATLIAVIIHSLSVVWVKRVSANTPPLAMTTGALIIACSLYFATWLIGGYSLPAEVPLQAGLSIVYLAIFGSVCGALLFYYTLRKTSAAAMALLTLITPVTALIIGNQFNDEVIHLNTLIGTSMIITALLIYYWPQLQAWLKERMVYRRLG